MIELCKISSRLEKTTDTRTILLKATRTNMAIISGATIITSLSLFHITLAFFFLTSPESITDQTLVFIIGEAMGMVILLSVVIGLLLTER